MKYIKVFNTESDYQTFKDEEDYVTPNVCLIEENNTVSFNPIPPPSLAGDVAYWADSKVKITPLSEWSPSLGTPVGVVVVPKGFAPDGKIRIASLTNISSAGTSTLGTDAMNWGARVDTALKNYTKLPLTDNNSSACTNTSNGRAYLPSDNFSGTTSYVDHKAKYHSSESALKLIPSPYLGDEPNPEYYKTLEGNNVLSDFNGFNNTETLVGLGTGYKSANAAWKYTDGISDLQWYLPAMGELGYIMPRFNDINATITALGGVILNFIYNSSTESSAETYYQIKPNDGLINGSAKVGGQGAIRAFAIIE